MLTRTIRFGSLIAALSSQLAAQEFDVVVHERDLMIEMRDGVKLATDIYRPARGGRLVEEPRPLLLQRTPYNKLGDSRVAEAEFFASHGYVVALQDLRGRFASEGEFTKYLGEGEDGFDAVEALAELSYVDGRVGMWGTSYAAHTQADAVKLRPPHLTTILLNMGGLENGWDHKIRNHGAFELSQITWAFNNLAAETKDPVVKALLEREAVGDWMKALPLRRGLNPLSVAPNFEAYVLDMMTHADYDDYWKHPDLNWVEHYDATKDIPMMHVSGWYDSYAGGTVNNFRELSKRLDSPVHLIMGPWTHGGNTRTHAGDVEFGPDAAISDFFREFHLRWFERFLEPPEPGSEDEVRLFVMGTGDGRRDENGRLFHGGYWRSESAWPVPSAIPTSFYFHGNGGLKTDVAAEDDMPTVYTFDPRDPVPTIGGAFSSSGPVFFPGAYDQRESEALYGAEAPYLPLRARSDVVTFQTDPLDEDLEVVGPIVVTLYVASTTVDTDFTVKLVDVYPPSADYPSGFDMNLTDGILRARYRETPEQQVLMTPGEVYELTIEPFPTANIFKKGHRIRVDVSSSNFPRFDVNPNTGEPLGEHRRMVATDNSIFHDAERRSKIVLPVIPAR